MLNLKKQISFIIGHFLKISLFTKNITRSTVDTICQFSFSVLNFLLTDNNAHSLSYLEINLCFIIL